MDFWHYVDQTHLRAEIRRIMKKLYIHIIFIIKFFTKKSWRFIANYEIVFGGHSTIILYND